MSEKTEKIIILGRSGSGKDFLMRKLVEKGLNPCIKYTSRPKRKFELDGVTYNYLERESFESLINENKFYSVQEFVVTPENSEPTIWYYGISNESFNESNVFIMTPFEFSFVTSEQRKGCFVVYLDIPREVRENRLFKREDKNDSIRRRMDADEMDFDNFNDYDLKITDPEFSADEVYDLMY
jgi:guanylate kinase